MPCKWLNNEFSHDDTPIYICEAFYKLIDKDYCKRCVSYMEGVGLHYTESKDNNEQR